MDLQGTKVESSFLLIIANHGLVLTLDILPTVLSGISLIENQYQVGLWLTALAVNFSVVPIMETVGKN